MKHYLAPWGILLKSMSACFTLLCLGIAVISWSGIGPRSGASFGVGWLLVALVLACALFIVRGYTVTPDAILVHRLVWTTRLPRAGLQSAQVKPHAMRWSLRAWGNGGFFSFTGWYYSRALGRYRAFVTDRRRTVVLRYGDRIAVLSPDAPDDFVQQLALPAHAA
ncbi:MAG: PH domain-containing protein [Verrucomicrobia bacterium]|nr:PH domain-containing protein [Verrucomicrobiota bacterium]